MVRRPAGGQRSAPKAANPPGSRSSRNARSPLGVTVKWRGGPEGWVELHARGAVMRVPGYVTIAEVVLKLNGQD